MSRLGCLGVVMVSVLSAAHARADEYYADPESGSMSNDGSDAQPWGSLEEIAAAGLFGTTIAAGDTLWLRSGYHGELSLQDGNFDPAITIAAEPGAEPELSHASIGGVSGLVLRGVSISPSHAESYETGTIVELRGESSNITIEDCDVFSEADVSGWGADEWINRASSGFEVSGDDLTVRNNRVRNVRFGISVTGLRALIDHNTVDGFSADGMRGLGDDEVFQYNVIKNSYVGDDMGDDNHDDGFQSWSVGDDGEVGTGEVRGVVLRGNLIINFEDPNQPMRTALQGVGCFDGTFVDWVVENNVVITDHWHGITLLGARNCRIVNNTVLDPNDQEPGPPWISIDAHKDGTQPEGCIVRNNLATDYADADSVMEDHNFTIEDPAALFVDPAARDLHLLPNASDAIDQGVADLAPELDRDGIARPQGAAIDLGAYEWHEPGVEPVDGGTGVSGASGSAGAAGSGVSDAGATAGATGTSGNGDSVSPRAGRGGSSAPATAGTSAQPSAGGSGPDADAGSDGASSDSGGCGCRIEAAQRSRSFVGLAPIAALVVALFRRRRRAA